MRRKTTASVEASTTVSLAYASEYGFGRTSGHAADRTSTTPEKGASGMLAGRRSRWALAGWFAGEDVEGVTVLRATEGAPVSFGLLETEDVHAVEQQFDLMPGVEGHVRVIDRPTVYRSPERTTALPPLPTNTRPAPEIGSYDQLFARRPD